VLRRYTNISAHNYYISPSLHHVLLVDLEPSTTYYYTVGDPAVSISAVFSFTTPQPTGFKSFPQTLGVYRCSSWPGSHGRQCCACLKAACCAGVIADLGQTPNSSVTLQHLIANKPGVRARAPLHHALWLCPWT
jgi:hypothetical protein